MGVFDDKRFEQLDWMTQITETIESNLNGLLARLPDKVEFDAASLLAEIGRGYGSNLYLSANNIVRSYITALNEARNVGYEEQRRLTECFQFEASPDFELDAESGTMKGSLILRKIVPTLEDEELQAMMGQKGLEQFDRVHWSDSSLSRIHEIMDLLGGLEKEMAGRAFRKKNVAVRRRLIEIFSKNEWRIRNMELADKIGLWIALYIRNGDLSALINLTKVKVMTHNNMPIYSIEEEK